MASHLDIVILEVVMIFRQLFDSTSSHTYLIASRKGGEALMIDPVFEKTDHYLRLLEELDLKLEGCGHTCSCRSFRRWRHCVITRTGDVMGEQSPVDVVSMRFRR